MRASGRAGRKGGRRGAWRSVGKAACDACLHATRGEESGTKLNMEETRDGKEKRRVWADGMMNKTDYIYISTVDSPSSVHLPGFSRGTCSVELERV